MSLVLEALRRVEKSSGPPGSVGVAVTSYRRGRRPRVALTPLLLGLGTGIALLLVWRPQMPSASPSPVGGGPEAGVPSVSAAPPPPLVLDVQASAPPQATSPAAPATPATLEPSRPASSPVSRSRASAPPAPSVVRPKLVLQAISERDSQPVAVINDQLVREGDLFQGARILRIGPESVQVRLETGEAAVVGFAPPPEAESSPDPESH